MTSCKKPPGASTNRMHRASPSQALPSLYCGFEGVEESNREALKIFDVARYESKTMSQSSCSNPGIVLRRFIRHVKSSATISYSPVNNKSSLLKFLSNCQKPLAQISALCRGFTLHSKHTAF